MPSVRDQIAAMETKYRRARFTIICHAIFIGVLCGAGALARRAIGLPPIFLATVLIAALLLFSGDIMKLFYCRNELRRLRDL
jgi:hypothetical protein